jgi:WD40 repeat protein
MFGFLQSDWHFAGILALVVTATMVGSQERSAAQSPATNQPGDSKTPLGMVRPLASIPAHPQATTFALLPGDGRRMFTGGSDGLVQVWNMATGELQQTLGSHDAAITSGALSRDGKLLVTGSYDKTVRLWDLEMMEEEATLVGHTDSVMAAAFSPDGKTIASCGNDRVFRLWKRETSELIFTSPEQDLPVIRVAFSPDGKLLATGAGKIYEWRLPSQVKLWNVESGEELAELPGHATNINTIVFSPDGKRIATGTAEGILHVWDVATRTETSATNFRSGIRTIAFFPDNQTTAVGQWPGRVFLWNIDTKQREATWSGYENPKAMVDMVVLSPDGSLVVSAADDGVVNFWPVPMNSEDGKRQLWKPPAGKKPATADLVRRWKPAAHEADKDAADSPRKKD